MGTGTIYLRGKTYWIQYYKRGKPFRESTKSTKKMVARTLLGKRLGQVAEGKALGINFDSVWFEDLVKGYLVPERKPLFLSFRLKGEIFELQYFQWHKISRSARNDNFG